MPAKPAHLRFLLDAPSCELEDFSAVVFKKENVAAKALADQISDLSPPTRSVFGRLLGRIEEGKARLTQRIDVRCSDRNRIISEKRIIIATGGSATAEMSMRYSTFNVHGSLMAAILSVLLITTAPEEFGIPECSNTLEAAGLEGLHRWSIFFFRPTPDGSRQVLSSRKDNCIVQIHRINAMETLVIMTM